MPAIAITGCRVQAYGNNITFLADVLSFRTLPHHGTLISLKKDGVNISDF
jgi:hypothetical protein